jgi:hypothetical protein
LTKWRIPWEISSSRSTTDVPSDCGGLKEGSLQYRDFLLIGIPFREGVEVVRDHTTPCEGVDVHRPKPVVVLVFPSSSAEVE